MSAELNSADLERGRTTAMIAALGRVQLTLDLIERRLGRVEDAVLEIGETLAAEREAGLVPAGLPYVDAIPETDDEPAAGSSDDPAVEPTAEPTAEPAEAPTADADESA